MGCTASRAQMFPNDIHPNVFMVQSLEQNGQATDGKLEVTSSELILYRKGHEPIHWPLQYLRRYGYEENGFSFECGRRCESGPGIFTFACAQAKDLFLLVQANIHENGRRERARRNLLLNNGRGYRLSMEQLGGDMGPLSNGFPRGTAVGNSRHPASFLAQQSSTSSPHINSIHTVELPGTNLPNRANSNLISRSYPPAANLRSTTPLVPPSQAVLGDIFNSDSLAAASPSLANTVSPLPTIESNVFQNRPHLPHRSNSARNEPSLGLTNGVSYSNPNSSSIARRRIDFAPSDPGEMGRHACARTGMSSVLGATAYQAHRRLENCGGIKSSSSCESDVFPDFSAAESALMHDAKKNPKSSMYINVVTPQNRPRRDRPLFSDPTSSTLNGHILPGTIACRSQTAEPCLSCINNTGTDASSCCKGCTLSSDWRSRSAPPKRTHSQPTNNPFQHSYINYGSEADNGPNSATLEYIVVNGTPTGPSHPIRHASINSTRKGQHSNGTVGYALIDYQKTKALHDSAQSLRPPDLPRRRHGSTVSQNSMSSSIHG